MKIQQESFFQKLSNKRLQDSIALEGFALRGVKNSVVEKYSDQAHFIYELLQNADDAKANSARFVLHHDKLIFAHNGSRRFSVSNPDSEDIDLVNGTLGDVNSITTVGASNKIDEAKIGKFGVGFKAVFQYTNTPEIYDPDIFFKIDRFIVPILLENDYSGRRQDETLFVFPFNHDQRSPEEAYLDISEKLKSLDYPLLFLNNLKEISYELLGVFGLYGKTIEETYDFDGTTCEYVRLTQNDGTDPDELNDRCLWLFSRDCDFGYRCSVGFFGNEQGQLIPKTHSAFCFFPTKTATGLNFIIHAPFLLNDSREGIKSGEEFNTKLISELSTLAADSIVLLRDIGLLKNKKLLDDQIFEIIPYDREGFNSGKTSFTPFYDSILRIFKSEKIIPYSDGYVEGENAYWAYDLDISKLFSDLQLSDLVGNKNAKWVFREQKRPDYAELKKRNYLDSIVRDSISDDKILRFITQSFIEKQTISWLHEFYKYLNSAKKRIDQVKQKPIFLNQDLKAVAAFDSNDKAILFLPMTDGTSYQTVHTEFLDNQETKDFIERLGIRKPSLRDDIYNNVLPLYESHQPTDHISNFRKFFRYYQECPHSQLTSFLNEIKETSFLFCRSSGEDKPILRNAASLYFPSDHLIHWFQTKPNTLFVDIEQYFDLIDKDGREDLKLFLRDLGVHETPKILSRMLDYEEVNRIKRYWPRTTRSYSWKENSIDGCNEIISCVVMEQSIDRSLIIWSQLMKLIKEGSLNDNVWDPNNVWYGRCEFFFRYERFEKFESSEAKRLRRQPWLVNLNGEFVTPEELTVSTMHRQYDVSSNEAVELIRLLGIAERIGETLEGDLRIIKYAESKGITEADILKLVEDELSRRQVAENRAAIRDQQLGDLDNSNGDYQHKEDNEITPTVQRIVKDILNKKVSRLDEGDSPIIDRFEEHIADEDEYIKPSVNYDKKIEKIKVSAREEIAQLEHLTDLNKKAQEAKKYTYAWFMALLELESMNSNENNASSREISITFSKVEREAGTSRTLILKHPNRHIPQSMEDLADIPLELRMVDQSTKRIAIEVVSVKSYTLRVKLRTNAEIDDIKLSDVVEARIEAKNPIFLIEELRKSLLKLGEEENYSDGFDMQNNLCENIEFVFGPPGTGKTTYLAEKVIRPLINSKEDIKVLVLTPTNKAADVIVRCIMDEMDSDQSYQNWLVRFGTTNDNVIEQSGVYRDKSFDIRAFQRNVTVTTIARFPYDYFLPDAMTRLHLHALKWDYIIIDEASMIPLANIIYPLYKKTPTKFVIAGDPFQIEPITSVDTWKNENIFTMVKLNSFTTPETYPHRYQVHLLTTQYRSKPEIGEVFSHFAYGGILKHHRQNESKSEPLVDGLVQIESLNIIKFPVSKYESIYRPKRLQSKSNYQVYSALFAFEFINHISTLINKTRKDEPFRIGLIAPYRAQADLIDKLMVSVKLPANIDVQVGTIHGFQGDECEMIVALFNPPPYISDSKEMFLNKLNILNVSISRARDYLFVLMPDNQTENVDRLVLVKRIEKLIKSQEHWTEHQSTEIEELIWGCKTYLEDNSFSTSHQLVNVYGKPEMRYEVRSEDKAIDVQIHKP